MQSRLFAAAVFALAFSTHPLFSQDATPTADQAQNQPAAHARRPLPKPTNLKVLPKDIAPEELVKIMRGYAGALGVECKFCHAPSAQGGRHLNFASDAKPDKAIARTMIQMTQTINETYMSQVKDPDAMPEDKHVQCGTCHRGHEMPEHFVSAPEEHHAPPQQGAATAQ
jgi:hypothetical protein